jgi:hypothetical protein
MIRQRRELSKPRFSPQLREPPACFFFIPQISRAGFHQMEIAGTSARRQTSLQRIWRARGQGWPFAFSPNSTGRWSASGHCFSITERIGQRESYSVLQKLGVGSLLDTEWQVPSR